MSYKRRQQPVVKSVSVIIPVHNQTEDLKLFLPHLITFAGGLDVEIIVIDDKSDEPITFGGLDVKVYRIENRLHRVKAINEWVRKATHDNILVCDPSIRFVNDTIQLMVWLLDTKAIATPISTSLYNTDLSQHKGDPIFDLCFAFNKRSWIVLDERLGIFCFTLCLWHIFKSEVGYGWIVRSVVSNRHIEQKERVLQNYYYKKDRSVYSQIQKENSWLNM